MYPELNLRPAISGGVRLGGWVGLPVIIAYSGWFADRFLNVRPDSIGK